MRAVDHVDSTMTRMGSCAMDFVDFTAELRDQELAHIALKRLRAVFVVASEFSDTLFKVAQGTLRRRMADDEPNEWLLQTRQELAGTAVVNTESLTDEQARSRFGTRSLPIWMSYTLRRELWMLETVRIHIDTISNLGSFIHLQALVYPQQSEDECRTRIREIRELLAPSLGGPISTDYAIMLDRDQAA